MADWSHSSLLLQQFPERAENEAAEVEYERGEAEGPAASHSNWNRQERFCSSFDVREINNWKLPIVI